MTNAFCRQLGQGFPDAGAAGGFSRVHGAMQSGLLGQPEGGCVRRPNVAQLVPGQIQRAHLVTVAGRQFRHFQAHAHGLMTEAADDQSNPYAGGSRTCLQPRIYGVQHLLKLQSSPRVQLRREAHLPVDHAVRCKVGYVLARDALEMVGVLHDLQCEIHAAEIVRQVHTHGRRNQRFPEGNRKVQADARRQVCHGADPHRGIEVAVQFNLGKANEVIHEIPNSIAGGNA